MSPKGIHGGVEFLFLAGFGGTAPEQEGSDGSRGPSGDEQELSGVLLVAPVVVELEGIGLQAIAVF